MKKALLSILLILICYFGYSQTTYPIQQNLGSSSTLVKNPNYGGFQGGLIPYTFADTSAANTALTYGKNYNGFEIYTQTPQAKWWRLADSSKWIMILPQGGGTPLSGQAWLNPGNFNLFTDAKLNGGFGTLARNGIYFKTNALTRMYLDKDGIAAETGTTVGLGIDLSDSNRITYFTGAAGWGLTGNSGTTAGTNFLGTTDDVNLMFKVNNIQSGLINKNSRNTSFGYQSLLANTTGTDNIAIGGNALIANEDGIENIGIGVYSLSSNESGGGNVAMGFTSLSANIVGSNNTAIGTNTLSASTGSANTAVGSTSLAGTTGSSNTGIGSSSLGSLTSGSSNIAIGSNASGYLTNESFRLAINSINRTNLLGDTTQSIIYGAQDAAATNQRLYLNSQVYLPYATAAANAADSMMVILPSTGKVGYRAIPTSSGGTVTGSGTTNTMTKWTSSTAIGDALPTDNGTTIGIISPATTTTGLDVSSSTLTSGALATFKSSSTAAAGNLQTGILDSVYGANATSGQTTYGSRFYNKHTGTSSTNVGALFEASGATTNKAIQTTGDVYINEIIAGYGKGAVNTNTVYGKNTLVSNTSGNNNLAMGVDVMSSLTSGASNAGIGNFSLNSNNGTYNTALGNYSLYSNTTAGYNVGVGAQSLFSNTNGGNNVGIGYAAGRYISGGATANTKSDNSIFIGYGTMPLAASQTNQIVIGYNSVGLGSNTMVLGNSSITTSAIYGNVGIGTSSPTQKLQVTGGRFGQAKGANVASAGDLTLGADGNVFHITGTTTINAILTTNWQAGSVIILIFDASVTVKNNTAGGASTAVMLLSGAADFSATLNDVLTLVYDGTSWFETARSVN